MAIPHAGSGSVVDLRPLGAGLTKTESTALVKTDAFEAIRLVLQKDKEVCHEHEVDAMVTIYCIEGRITLTIADKAIDLPAGHWCYLNQRERHTVKAVEPSSLLLTIMFSKTG